MRNRFVNKNILIISPEPWDHIFVSKHHYAVHLAKRDNKVFFLQPPNSESMLLSKTEYDNVWKMAYNGFIKGFRYLPRGLQQRLILKKFKKIQKLCGEKIDIIWSFDNSVFFDLNLIPNNILKINHIVDLNQDFQLRSAAVTADFCLCSSDPIKKKLTKYNSKTFKINHGYNLVEEVFCHKKLPGKNLVKCFYAGNLDIPYIDWPLIILLVENYPEVDFVFAGKWTVEKEKKEIIDNHNFYYIGQQRPTDLPVYYSQADILLICYQYQKYKDQLSNPHKMMEYLGSGKMIMATKTEEYLQLAAERLIAMSDLNSEYLELFNGVLNNLDLWNSFEKQNRRKTFALKNTYGKQIDKIELLIEKNVSK